MMFIVLYCAQEINLVTGDAVVTVLGRVDPEWETQSCVSFSCKLSKVHSLPNFAFGTRKIFMTFAFDWCRSGRVWITL